MGTVNKVILLGNLGQDPDLRSTRNGTAVCNLRVATSDRWTDSNGEQHERTEWHDVVTWDRQAEACGKHLSKGSQVYIEGRLQTRKWEDRDGNTRYTTEVQATQVIFLSTREERSKLADNYREGGPQQQAPDYPDEIPF